MADEHVGSVDTSVREQGLEFGDDLKARARRGTGGAAPEPGPIVRAHPSEARDLRRDLAPGVERVSKSCIHHDHGAAAAGAPETELVAPDVAAVRRGARGA